MRLLISSVVWVIRVAFYQLTAKCIFESETKEMGDERLIKWLLKWEKNLMMQTNESTKRVGGGCPLPWLCEQSEPNKFTLRGDNVDSQGLNFLKEKESHPATNSPGIQVHSKAKRKPRVLFSQVYYYYLCLFTSQQLYNVFTFLPRLIIYNISWDCSHGTTR